MLCLFYEQLIFSSLSNFRFDSFGSEFGSGTTILKPGSHIIFWRPVKPLKFYIKNL